MTLEEIETRRKTTRYIYATVIIAATILVALL